MTIKIFDFPSFEEWNKTQEYTQKIGDYTCRIGVVTFWTREDPRNDYQAAIANFDCPTNIYVPKIFSEKITYNISDEKNLKEWYETVIVKLNDEWKKFILEKYCCSKCDPELGEIPDENSYNRIITIIKMLEHITGLPRNEIIINVKNTDLYRQIIKKNRSTLYDGIPGNLTLMVSEWRQEKIPTFGEITAYQIFNSYDWIEGIVD